MKVFKLEIKMGNAEMLTPMDIADALNEVAAHISNACDLKDVKGIISDLNGNKVGLYKIVRR